MILSRAEFERIRIQAENEYPSECCGVVLEKDGVPKQRLLFRCSNVQNEVHAEDPDNYPRTARTAYKMHVQDVFEFNNLERDGYRVRVIYHSHIDTEAYFSPTDKAEALMNGEPMYPEAIYVVVSVVEGRAAKAAAFAWRPEKRDFVSLDFPRP